MRVLCYKDLAVGRLGAQLKKVLTAIANDDFKSPNVKKLQVGPYYRAKLDDSNRLLLTFMRHAEQTVCLVLEVIANHAYDKSRFLRGATVDWNKLEDTALDALPDQLPSDDVRPLRWLHPQRTEFELLDKPIQFDDVQQALLSQKLPWIMVGSAGSGKTAVTLSRLREAKGQVLYVTQSSYLAQSALDIYRAYGYANAQQEVVFLSYREFLETLRVPEGREVRFTDFSAWFERQRAGLKALGALDAQALLEEFRGVICAQPGGPLTLEAYQALGLRQSLFPSELRPLVLQAFGRYQTWLTTEKLFDLALLAHDWHALAEPSYDFVVIDEVQDLTSAQVALVLACLKKTPTLRTSVSSLPPEGSDQFLLCGDSNQIVHPNFFSWAALRALFWKDAAHHPAQSLHVLQANFRNTQAVTLLANRLLKIKQARFGSIDRESNYLVQSQSTEPGLVTLVPDRAELVQQLNQQTRASAKHAVLVLRDEDKTDARRIFQTPLIFSVHEAKGLEYPHVVLYCPISRQRSAYQEVCAGVSAADVAANELRYSRGRDKNDKSLELYKFYVNALYVAMTRAVESLTWLESDIRHPLLDLLGLSEGVLQTTAPKVSSQQEWAQEARRLELQGKQEQAQAIRETFLAHRPVPWPVWSREMIEAAVPKALDPKDPSTKTKQLVMDYALWHGQSGWLGQLGQAGLASARQMAPDGCAGLVLSRQAVERYGYDHKNFEEPLLRSMAAIQQRHLQAYEVKNFKSILQQCDVHGVDHPTPTGATPLMMAARAGHVPLIESLLERGANPLKQDEFGQNAWLHALHRAWYDSNFARHKLAPLFPHLAPTSLDVQTDQRLYRITPNQGEYWVLMLMWAGIKTLHTFSACHAFPMVVKHFEWRGFTAESIEQVLLALPEHLWPATRRKRSYINGVLARAERDSSYIPSRKLWCRLRIGTYYPNPCLQVRQGENWQWLHQALALDWVEKGCDLRAIDDRPLSPLGTVHQMVKKHATDQNHLPAMALPEPMVVKQFRYL